MSSKEVEIISEKTLTATDSQSTVIFLFDKGKRNLDLTTEKYFEMGFRVFAFKEASTKVINPFGLSLTVLGLWRKILSTIQETKTPFIVTYSYMGKALNKTKGFGA